MFIFGLHFKHCPIYILVSGLMLFNIFMYSCNSEQKQKTKFGRWEIMRQADWKTRFYDVFFIDSQTGWAVGNSEGNSIKEEFNSVIAHTSDGGQHWTSQESGTIYPLRKVQFIDNQNGWIIGENGTILNTKDGGKNWLKQQSNTLNNLFDLHFFTDKVGWIIGDYSTMLHTENGGMTWTSKIAPAKETSLRGLHFLDQHYGWIVSYEGNIYATTNGGHSWTNQKNNILNIRKYQNKLSISKSLDNNI